MNNKIHALPCHIAIIMDGNGRWALQQGLDRLEGHKQGVNIVKEVVEEAAKKKIQYLTLYTFSTENWTRPDDEVNGLMELLVMALEREMSTLLKNNIRLSIIGDIAAFSETVQRTLHKCITKTANNTGLNLILALNYGGRKEIVHACKKIAQKIMSHELDVEEISEDTVAQCLFTSNIPDPDLMIRTSGEMRLSNFMLWQLAYSEYYFTTVLWPDFKKDEFNKAIDWFGKRKRRFGSIDS